MQGIVLASHGDMAKGLLQTSTLFFGEQPQLKACCLMANDNPDEFMNVIEKAMEEVNSGDGVIVLCDMLFGTPCNCTGRIVAPKLDDDKIQVVCGMNLAMILQVLSTREANTVTSEELVNAGIEGVVDLKKRLKEFSQGE